MISSLDDIFIIIGLPKEITYESLIQKAYNVDSSDSTPFWFLK